MDPQHRANHTLCPTAIGAGLNMWVVSYAGQTLFAVGELWTSLLCPTFNQKITKPRNKDTSIKKTPKKVPSAAGSLPRLPDLYYSSPAAGTAGDSPCSTHYTTKKLHRHRGDRAVVDGQGCPW